MTLSRSFLVTAMAFALAACAAQKSGQSPPAQAEGAVATPAEPEPSTYAPPPPGAPEAAPRPPAQPTTATGARPSSRAVALRQAASDIEASQRELDVAGGDCRNACRALSSMDRAAGRICGLAESDDEQRRCTDARTRLYSARDKVRGTCGTCPDVSVDRSAPIPSR